MDSKMRYMLDYALKNVEYYKERAELYSENFNQLPLLEKEVIRNNPLKFVSGKYNIEDLILERTSGSTGIPMTIYRSKGDELRAGKSLWKLRRTFADISPIDKYVNFFIRRYFEDGRVNSSKIIQNGNILELNLVYLSPETIKLYIEAILDFQPKWIFGPPSVLFFFAKYILDSGKKFNFNFLEMIELSGEYCTIEQKNYIQNAFKVKTFLMYGSMESLCIAYMCPYNHFHINEENVYLETQKNNELIVSCYNSFAMPLIRYKIGDFGYTYNFDCECGLTSNCLHLIQGRVGQTVIINEKRYNTAIFYTVIKDVEERFPDTIGQFQFKKEKKDSFSLKIVPTKKFEPNVISELQTIFYKYFNLGISKIELVDIIQLKNNKLSYYVEN